MTSAWPACCSACTTSWTPPSWPPTAGPTWPPWADADARQAWTRALLERLVALNPRRAADEARGLIRWRHPDYQARPAAQRKPRLPQILQTLEAVGRARHVRTQPADLWAHA